MSKAKKLKVSKKPEQSSLKVSPILEMGKNTPLSPPENISAIPSSDAAEFEKAVNQSKTNIAQADEAAKGKRGRKALPRDAAGNIIRTDAAAIPQNGIPAAPLNQQSIEENKIIVRNVFPVVNNAAENYAGDAKARATKEEEDAIVNCSAILLEKYMPTIMGKFGTEATMCFVLLAWGKRIQTTRAETIARIRLENSKKSELQNGGIPSGAPSRA